MNRFLKILESARDNKWCMNLYCTTCGATEFRSAMKQLGDGLADELASLDLSVLTEMPNWDETIRLVLDDIRKAELMDRVLTAWLPQLDRNIRMADLILFYYVRRGAINAPMSIEVLQRWREKCVELAVQTGNESLVESLIYTLGDFRKYPELDMAVQKLVARGARRVEAALRQQGFEIPSL
ncbi:MAG: hypothetical protein ACOYL3_17445 [Desulfuromonadaceae bacterium]